MNQLSKMIDAYNKGNLIEQLTHPVKTHIDRHSKTTDVQSLERLFTDVPSSSIFTDQETANMFIEDTLTFHDRSIQNWLDTARHGETWAIRQDFRDEGYDETVGRGVVLNKNTHLIKEYNTDAIRVVLQKDNTMPLGCTLITAYPDMENPHIVPTERNLNAITKQTETYQKADPVGKAYLLYRTHPKNKASVSYIHSDEPTDSAMILHVETQNPNTYHEIKIKESGTFLTTKTVDIKGKRNISTNYTQLRDNLHPDKQYQTLTVRMNKPILDAFAADYPQEAFAIRQMRRTLDETIPYERNERAKYFETQKQKTYTPSPSKHSFNPTTYSAYSAHENDKDDYQYEG